MARLLLWVLEFPAVKATLAVAVVFCFLLVGLYGVVRFILWLIVEPYRNHKRLEADAKRETEGPVE
ncbi:hypothetical protein R7M47_05300 [Bacillus inaquosorum]|uniref:hypothetical protein n=1 Tax=Bacillus inaquosorum TaxID=483913 RepID=UPI00389A779B